MIILVLGTHQYASIFLNYFFFPITKNATYTSLMKLQPRVSLLDLHLQADLLRHFQVLSPEVLIARKEVSTVNKAH